MNRGCFIAFISGAVTGAFGCSSTPGAAPAVVAAQTTRGDHDFHDRALAGPGGNGRACSDCHRDEDSFQLGPVAVEARFQQMRATGVDDPLFRPIDADDYVTNGDAASDYGNLRHNGLIRVRLALPANMKVVDPTSCTTEGLPAPCDIAATYAVSTAAFTDVWRAVPSVLNVSLTGNDGKPSVWPRGPNPQGGYQLDGRVDTLQEQARGALINHAQAAEPPGAETLDDIAAYEDGLLAPAEPAPGELTELEAQGKTIFERACTQCHHGPGMSTPLTTAEQLILRFHDDQAACPRSVDTASPPRWNLPPCPPELARNVQIYEISFADGFKMRRASSDPGRALLTGFVASSPPAADGSCLHAPCAQQFQDDWQKLEIAPLHGISKTAPYFHNNSAATLEDVAIHYEEVFKRIEAQFPLPNVVPALSTDGIHLDRPNLPSERAALVAYLERL